MFEIANVGLLAAFLGGLISFLSPCVLPLVPGYLSFITGQTIRPAGGGAASFDGDRHDAVVQAAWFIAGFTTIFMLLGASATMLGRLLLSYRYEAQFVGGIAIIVFGLMMTGILRFNWLQREWRFLHRINLVSGRPSTAYLLGVAFAVGWTPCIGPVLGAILTVSVSSGGASSGLFLLGVYSLGLAVPFMLTALSVNKFLHHQRVLQRWGRILHPVAGGIMILMGVMIMTGTMTIMSFWLLDQFPILELIG
ncbi:cytochrome c biogenesis protein CcdA [Natronospirillum operosum]|uniref:Cytochrome c biogenesis protein CcdA n=1 Tax=Natronospirillum operosum TaxID=2759953 RepID=A0A4Z0WA41_9GAMM|nr:cytochrome c biogenesis protein CcdA [Natronospirillum operosum]TGG94079.1 cytochrome c biogenesis protein CcdA [Natronospirillum operosum]